MCDKAEIAFCAEFVIQRNEIELLAEEVCKLRVAIEGLRRTRHEMVVRIEELERKLEKHPDWLIEGEW